MNTLAGSLAITIVLSCVALAVPQTKIILSPNSPKVFSIGMSREEMIATFGKPAAYFGTRTQRHIPADQSEAACSSELCRPIYTRKTKANEYEIVVTESPDVSQSRLHPTARIRELRFHLDHEMKPADAINDIDELRELCRGKCTFGDFYGLFTATAPDSNVRIMFLPGNPKTQVGQDTPIASVSIAPVH